VSSAPVRGVPLSKETPPGQFPRSRYEEIAHTSGVQGAEAPLGSPLFACHMTIEGRDAPCAGWLAAVGIESLPVRVLIAYNELPASVLEPGPDWPELYGSYAEMVDAQGAVGTKNPEFP
jgi:hypothetical protein